MSLRKTIQHSQRRPISKDTQSEVALEQLFSIVISSCADIQFTR